MTCEKSRAHQRSRAILPPHAPGLKIGLFGGTFDPPHRAHLAASLLAMRRLGLDRIWWLVTPGNPLKDTRHLESLERRLAMMDKLKTGLIAAVIVYALVIVGLATYHAWTTSGI